MLLTGTHPRTLDDKNRLVLPKRVRDQLGEATERLFIAQGMDQCLWLYDQEALEQLAEKLDRVPATDTEARVFRRLFFAQMEGCDIDKAGRVLVPDRLVDFAKLKHEVVLLGVRDHLELWDAGRWQDYLAQHATQFDKVAEGTFRESS
jgi:MraZ protein